MTAILLLSDILIYKFFARSLYRQLDERLFNLANAATHSLAILKKNPQNLNEKSYKFDHDGDLDIPWQNLRETSQSIEWFNAQKQKIVQSGTIPPDVSLQEGWQIWQKNKKIRILTIAAYSLPNNQQTLEGFVRVSESSEEIETDLAQLRLGCYLGNLAALGLIGIGGMWLTSQAIKPIEKSYQQLKQFTTDASHELRTPLTAIKTSVEVLQTHPERIHPADVTKFEGILSATNQISGLVEDLLLLARTDNNLVIPSQQLSVIPLDELLEDVIIFLEPKAQAKNITIETNWQNLVSVKGEVNQLYRLFVNLLDNAIKYTPRGGLVTLTLQKSEQFALFTIEDTGIGIASEHLPLIFSRFWREDSVRSTQEGTGLGLSIVQAIVMSHGGKINVTSTLGLGTCFEVSLPLFSAVKS